MAWRSPRAAWRPSRNRLSREGAAMPKRRLILLLVALLIAAGTAQLARSILHNAPPVAEAPPPIKTVRVLVAASDLPAGLLIQPDHLKWRAWPEGSTDDYIVEGARPIEEF